MPFTLSHPAAAVPLARYGLPLSALVVGSMMPDAPYFLRFPRDIRFGHTLPGLFIFCIPAGLAALWLFHRVLKLPLLSLFPLHQQERLICAASPFTFGPMKRFLLIVAALLVGAFTHIAWDAFTHDSTWLVRHAPLLRVKVFHLAHEAVTVCRLLQYVSTLAGAGLLLWWYVRWLRQAPAQPVRLPVPVSQRARLWLIALMAVISFFSGTAHIYLALRSKGVTRVQSLVAYEVIAVMAYLAVEILLFSLIWHLQALRIRRLEIPGDSPFVEQGRVKGWQR